MADTEPENKDTIQEQTAEPATNPRPHARRFVQCIQWLKAHKKLTIPGAIILLLTILMAVPYTRYILAGTVVRQNMTIWVVDAETGKPVSSALVKIAGKEAVTDGQGQASLRLNAGTAVLQVEKKYYKTSRSEILTPIFRQKQPLTIKLKATGRQVTMSVVNKLSQKGIKGATITALDTRARTDHEGKAVLVVPTNTQQVPATVTADGFAAATLTLSSAADSKAATIQLTPQGRVYFLSNANGKIDVVKANLDGSDRQTVLAGTGKESKSTTALLASRDWKYLALLSRRDDSQYSKVYLIDTTNNDVLTTMDEGEASFSFVGWSDHRFIYRVNRNKQAWEPNTAALKSYDATSKKITTLDQSGGEGNQFNYVFSVLDEIFILKNEIVYVKEWQSNYSYAASQTLRGKKSELRSVRADGTNNRIVAAYSIPEDVQSGSIGLNARLYEPQGIWIKASFDDKKTEEYENGALRQIADVSLEEFYDPASYPTYLVSPDASKTFWSEERDGKNVLSVGDADAKSAKQIASASPYSAFGWYTDDYVLVSKEASELYIMPVQGGPATKLTNYYKTQLGFAGYGSGYGGL